jgi:hypothetical protein
VQFSDIFMLRTHVLIFFMVAGDDVNRAGRQNNGYAGDGHNGQRFGVGAWHKRKGRQNYYQKGDYQIAFGLMDFTLATRAEQLYVFKNVPFDL